MTPATIFLITEITRILLEKLQATGQLGTLTPEQANEMIVRISGQLETNLPSPEDLASGKAS